MEEKSTKISFGFSKITKKPAISKPKPEFIKKVDKIQYIDSMENKSFNVINEDKPPEKIELVIPMKNPNDLLDSMKEAVKSRVEVSKEINNEKETVDNSDAVVKIETLDEMAARELMAVSKKEEEEVVNNFTVPMSEKNKEQKESTLEDYENIPIKDFGLAMLRGMGWQPAKGIGKSEQVVKTEMPKLRPKGMGLGADQVIKPQKPTGMKVEADSVLKKDSKVRITVGKHKNLYGTIQGFDDDSGRISIKLSIGSEIIWINECFVQLVTISEFDKYSQVINLKTYTEYKDENEDSKEIVNSATVRSSEKYSKNSDKNIYSSPHSSDGERDYHSKQNSNRPLKKYEDYKKSKRYESNSMSSHDSDSQSSSDDTYSERDSKQKCRKDEMRSRKTEHTRRNEYSKNRHKKNYDSSSDSEYYSKRDQVKKDKRKLSKDKRKRSSEDSRRYKSHRSSSPEEYERSSKKKHKKKERRSRSYEDKKRKHR